MNSTKSPKVVLIVDDDLGFVMWLGQVLSKGGFLPVPARTGAEALARLKDFGVTPDLAIVNPGVHGGASLIENLKPKTSVFSLEVPAAGARGVMKRSTPEEPAGEKWVAKVKRAIAGT